LRPSTAVGGYIGPGVDAREAHPIPLCWSCAVPPCDDEMVGESMLMSSLTVDDSARGKVGGGGV
jgi:hypothetical protein